MTDDLIARLKASGASMTLGATTAALLRDAAAALEATASRPQHQEKKEDLDPRVDGSDYTSGQDLPRTPQPEISHRPAPEREKP